MKSVKRFLIKKYLENLINKNDKINFYFHILIIKYFKIYFMLKKIKNFIVISLSI